jgi:uncharacterized membrane protein (GlpM family)
LGRNILLHYMVVWSFIAMLVYFMAIWYFSGHFGNFFILVCCIKKNLAYLVCIWFSVM